MITDCVCGLLNFKLVCGLLNLKLKTLIFPTLAFIFLLISESRVNLITLNPLVTRKAVFRVNCFLLYF